MWSINFQEQMLGIPAVLLMYRWTDMAAAPCGLNAVDEDLYDKALF